MQQWELLKKIYLYHLMHHYIHIFWIFSCKIFHCAWQLQNALVARWWWESPFMTRVPSSTLIFFAFLTLYFTTAVVQVITHKLFQMECSFCCTYKNNEIPDYFGLVHTPISAFLISRHLYVVVALYNLPNTYLLM